MFLGPLQTMAVRLWWVVVLPTGWLPHQHNIPRITRLHVDYLPITLLCALSALFAAARHHCHFPAARSGKCLVPFPIFVSSEAFCGRIATGEISSTERG